MGSKLFRARDWALMVLCVIVLGLLAYAGTRNYVEAGEHHVQK